MDNCIRIKSRSPFHYRFVFVDTHDHISFGIFTRNGLRIKKVKELVRDGSPFRLIICSIRKRDLGRFKEALDVLKRNALLLGYRDYDDMCKMLINAAAADS
ncbi:MAG: hypothetical protein K5886_08905 [Lachnospiraceae bacterium]|nr:hypothetical protein [Lachnospiraceae bacterium]